MKTLCGCLLIGLFGLAFVVSACADPGAKASSDASDGDLTDGADGDQADGQDGQPADGADGDAGAGDGDLEQDGGADAQDGSDEDGSDGDGSDEDGSDGQTGDPDGEDGDGATGDGDAVCEPTEPFDYTCQADDPTTCPEGICLFGMCIAPVLDQARWADCGDGACGPCETESGCPADCGVAPTMSGTKEYDNDTTITVWLHGFYNKSPEEMASMTYGQTRGCADLVAEFASYGIQRPCGDVAPGDTAPDQVARLEYYGGQPAAWLSQADIDAIEQYSYEGTEALHRYALIAAKYIRHKLTVSGASHVNLCCHSMGCLITRHMIEHDLEGLASENRFVRWFSSAGVLPGARLARLYDNPTIRSAAEALGLELNDFVIMHPDFVTDHTAIWDHRPLEANNPMLGGMILHHATATDPHIQEAAGVTLLDLNNPGDEPNDGIMYSLDEFFHSQNQDVALTAPGGRTIQPTRTCRYVDHMSLPDSDSAALLATATLFHRRKVFIKIQEIDLLADREHHAPFDGEAGQPPAEITAAVEVRYDPYVSTAFGKDVIVHQTSVEHRSAEMFSQAQDTFIYPDYTLFEGPVFDAMTELHLRFDLLEVDWYPRLGVLENVFDAHEALLTFDQQVPLFDQILEVESAYARLRIAIELVDQY